MAVPTVGRVVAALVAACGIAALVAGSGRADAPDGAPTASGPSGDKPGIAQCDATLDVASQYGAIDRLVVGESASAGEVADWQEKRNAPLIQGVVSPFRLATSATETLAVCVFAGEFSTPTGPVLVDGTVPPRHTTITLIVGPEGTVALDSSGYLDARGTDTPSQWRARVASGSLG